MVRPPANAGYAMTRPEGSGTGSKLVDRFGRVHTKLRVSVTDRCNIRCFYCMPEDTPDYVPREEILSFEEIERVVRILVELGIRKVRLTGGEPLVRRGIAELVARLNEIPGVEGLSLTTNGLLLPELADDLYRAGLRSINVHLDTLDRERFRFITRYDGLHRVLAGIDRCLELGFAPVKINAVAVKGLTESDIVPLADFARRKGVTVRFIEFMPLDAANQWERERVLLAEEIINRINAAFPPLEPVADQDPTAPALEYVFADGVGRIGIIASVSRPFCGHCNRLRLTADGKFRYCLFAIEEFDIKALLRSGATDNDIARLILEAVSSKWEGHEINTARFIRPERPMYSIGG